MCPYSPNLTKRPLFSSELHMFPHGPLNVFWTEWDRTSIFTLCRKVFYFQFWLQSRLAEGEGPEDLAWVYLPPKIEFLLHYWFTFLFPLVVLPSRYSNNCKKFRMDFNFFGLCSSGFRLSYRPNFSVFLSFLLKTVGFPYKPLFFQIFRCPCPRESCS